MKHLKKCKKKTREVKVNHTNPWHPLGNGRDFIHVVVEWRCARKCPVRHYRAEHGQLPPETFVCGQCGLELLKPW
jgi:hypothetical protein